MVSISRDTRGLPFLSSDTAYQSSRALLWTALITAFFAIWYAFDKWVIDIPTEFRLVRSPAQVGMIIMAIPHIILAFVFMVTSQRMQGTRAWFWLSALFVTGVGLCYAFQVGGGAYADHRIPSLAVAAYFIVHHLRDEGSFYRIFDGRSSDAAELDHFLKFAMRFTYSLVIGALLARYLLRYENVGALAMGTLLLATVAVPLGFYLNWRSTSEAGLIKVASRHRPIVIVHGLFLVVLFASRGNLSVLILWHVMEWFFFALSTTKSNSGISLRTPVQWMRKTRTGFLLAHVGFAVLLLGTMIVWTYAHGRVSSLGYAVDYQYLYFWTIMHVTLSFQPKLTP